MTEASLYLLQQIINGLTIGSTYALIAIGYTMVYGIIGMINFAHGEVYMIGSYISFIVITGLLAMGHVALPLILFIALLVAIIVASSYGWRSTGRLSPAAQLQSPDRADLRHRHVDLSAKLRGALPGITGYRHAAADLR